MAVTRSSATTSSASHSNNVRACHVHNEPPANLFKSNPPEPRSPRYFLRHPRRRSPGQRVTLHSTGVRPTRPSKKLQVRPTNSPVDLSQARSHRHSKPHRSHSCKRSYKRRMGNSKKFDKACIKAANKTLDIWESWDAAHRGSPYKMKRNAARVAAVIQTNKPKLHQHETIQRLNENVLRRTPRLPIV